MEITSRHGGSGPCFGNSCGAGHTECLQPHPRSSARRNPLMGNPWTVFGTYHRPSRFPAGFACPGPRAPPACLVCAQCPALQWASRQSHAGGSRSRLAIRRLTESRASVRPSPPSSRTRVALHERRPALPSKPAPADRHGWPGEHEPLQPQPCYHESEPLRFSRRRVHDPPGPGWPSLRRSLDKDLAKPAKWRLKKTPVRPQDRTLPCLYALRPSLFCLGVTSGNSARPPVRVCGGRRAAQSTQLPPHQQNGHP
jgi:hypothetical protein